VERKVNPDSNFRKYYLNDSIFYTGVIKREDPPYDFKIHVFLDSNKSGDDEGEG